MSNNAQAKEEQYFKGGSAKEDPMEKVRSLVALQVFIDEPDTFICITNLIFLPIYSFILSLSFVHR
jgi:hypothetical protein